MLSTPELHSHKHMSDPSRDLPFAFLYKGPREQPRPASSGTLIPSKFTQSLCCFYWAPVLRALREKPLRASRGGLARDTTGLGCRFFFFFFNLVGISRLRSGNQEKEQQALGALWALIFAAQRWGQCPSSESVSCQKGSGPSVSRKARLGFRGEM